MKSSVRIPVRASAGFAADPDPTTNPGDVPPSNVFRASESLPTDGSPNTLLAWLTGLSAGAATVEVWALDDDSLNVSPSDPFAPSEDHVWTKLVAATAVTAPTCSAFTGKLFAGFLYVRQTVSTLAGAATLKVQPACL